MTIIKTLAALAVISITAMPLAANAENLPMIDGQVKEVKNKEGKVTIKHAPIPNLDMGPMTMVFTAKEKSMIKGLKVGDKIKFQTKDIGGKLTIMKLEKAK